MTDIATQLEDAAHAFARGDDASMDLITNAVRELRRLRLAIADAEEHLFHHRQERAVEVLRAAAK